MNYLDVVLSVPLLWGLYKGVTRGIIKELSTLLALILGVYGAINYSDLLSPILADFITIGEDYQSIFSFSLVFILIVLVVRLLAALLDKLISFVSLTVFSRLAGALFGIFRMAFLCSALLLVVNTLNNRIEIIPHDDIEQSLLFQPISDLVPLMSSETGHGESIIENAKKTLQNVEQSIIP